MSGYGDYFNEQGFKNFYFSSSRYADKERLYTAFRNIYFDMNGRSLNVEKRLAVKAALNAANKKKIKTQLIGKGFSGAAADGLFKSCGTWIKNNA